MVVVHNEVDTVTGVVPAVVVPLRSYLEGPNVTGLPPDVVQWLRAVAAALVVGFVVGALIWGRRRAKRAKRELAATRQQT